MANVSNDDRKQPTPPTPEEVAEMQNRASRIKPGDGHPVDPLLGAMASGNADIVAEFLKERRPEKR